MLLEIGDSVRYKGLGTGRVIRHTEREFQGEMRIFALVEFPHRDMTMHVPVGDPAVMRKLSLACGKELVLTLLNALREPGGKLARTWDQREEHGVSVLRNGGPDEWAALLQAYATARGEGLSVAASDADLVREAQELLAAEMWGAIADLRYEEALGRVKDAYEQAVSASAKRVKRGEQVRVLAT